MDGGLTLCSMTVGTLSPERLNCSQQTLIKAQKSPQKSAMRRQMKEPRFDGRNANLYHDMLYTIS